MVAEVDVCGRKGVDHAVEIAVGVASILAHVLLVEELRRLH